MRERRLIIFIIGAIIITIVYIITYRNLMQRYSFDKNKSGRNLGKEEIKNSIIIDEEEIAQSGIHKVVYKKLFDNIYFVESEFNNYIERYTKEEKKAILEDLTLISEYFEEETPRLFFLHESILLFSTRFI